MHVAFVDCFDELGFVDVAVAFEVGGGKGLLEGDAFGGEGLGTQFGEEGVWLVLGHLGVEVDFFDEEALDVVDLDDTRVVGVQFVQNQVDFLISKIIKLTVGRSHHFAEILLNPLPRAESEHQTGCKRVRRVLSHTPEVTQVHAMGTHIVRELLERWLGPPLNSLQILPLVPIVEVLDRFLELDLSCPQRMNLHELLQVEEGL